MIYLNKLKKLLKKRKLFFEKLKKLGILLVTERREPKKRNVKMQKLNTTDYKVMEKIMKNSKYPEQIWQNIWN